MGQKTVRFSDLSGQLITNDEGLARIVVHEHPELVDGPVEIEALADFAWERMGGVDLLFNNAGASRVAPAFDISDPAHPRQIAYWRPDDTLVWASYMHNGYVYTADHTRGIEVLRLTGGAKAAKAAKREVVAPAMSAKQRRFLASMASQLKSDPATAGLCLLAV